MHFCDKIVHFARYIAIRKNFKSVKLTSIRQQMKRQRNIGIKHTKNAIDEKRCNC